MLPLFRRADPARRRIGPALIAGLIAGVISGFVKLGWEQLLPPRTPDRDQEPLIMLNDLGVNADRLTFHFSGQEVNWGSLLVHFGFSIVVVLFYAVVAEFLPGVKLWLGIVYGLGVWVVFHLIVMPLLGLTPALSALPAQENISEALGHAVWLLSAELVRQNVRRRLTGQPDADVAEALAA